MVEDDAVSRDVALAQRRTLGFDATGAGSCRDAMCRIGRRPLPVVLIDCGLPDGDGYGLARRIRRRERLSWWRGARSCRGGRLPPALPQALRELCRSSCLFDLAALKLAVECREWRQAREHAHRTRGASQVVGAHVVAGIASVLERVGGDRPADDRAQTLALGWLHRILEPSSHGLAGWPA